MIQIAANLWPFEQVEAHLVENMFYNKWVQTGESSVSKPQGNFVPRWEDIQDDLKPDLRRQLMQKKKWKEAPALESDDAPQCVKVQTPDGKIVYKLWRCAVWLKKVLKEKVMQKKEEEITAEKDK